MTMIAGALPPVNTFVSVQPGCILARMFVTSVPLAGSPEGRLPVVNVPVALPVAVAFVETALI